MKHLLVLRFSALGDVAMTVPVLYSLATQYPDLRIGVVSRKGFSPLFERLPENVYFIPADFKGEHKGIAGLRKLFRELRKMKFDGVADLHDVLRTRFLRTLFRFAGVRTAHIHKGRKEKRALTRRRHKVCKPLKTSFDRYKEVFNTLGFSPSMNFVSLFDNKRESTSRIQAIAGEKEGMQWIGIAPFAKHAGKNYPLSSMKEVMARLSQKGNVKIFLFGGGKEEEALLSEWEQTFPNTISLPGKLKMSGELELMNRLDLMVTMDSANMHLASLVNTPVISVWGATHPWCGFMGWGQDIKNAVQLELSCRPCSVFGNKPCFREDYACLNQITSDELFNRIIKLLEG